MEQKGKRKDFKQGLKNISALRFFTGGGYRVVVMVGRGGYAKGLCSVLPELRSCFLLGGLGEGQVVKNIVILLSAETLAADSSRRWHLCYPCPILPGMDIITSGQR